MITLIDEDEGLRVSDIHTILGGNKSWISTLCKGLSNADLASSTKTGREVYYKLTEKGSDIASHAYSLIFSLIKVENFDYILHDDTYLLEPNFIQSENIFQELWKIGYPLYTHKGAVLLNRKENYFYFIGKDQNTRPFTIDFFLKDLRRVEYRFDECYKRRYSPRVKPLIIEYIKHNDEDVLQKIYLFVNYRKVSRTTKNSKWFEILNEELDHHKQEKEETPLLESEDDVSSTV